MYLHILMTKTVDYLSLLTGTTILILMLTVANDTKQAHQMLENINLCHETIKFDLETPNANGYLPILDIMINISASGQYHENITERKRTVD